MAKAKKMLTQGETYGQNSEIWHHWYQFYQR